MDRGHNWENICIGLFHVSGVLDHFGRYLLLVKKIKIDGMIRPPPSMEISTKFFYFFLFNPSLNIHAHFLPRALYVKVLCLPELISLQKPCENNILCDFT